MQIAETLKTKMAFWVITSIVHLILFLGYSYVSNQFATPTMVEQKILTLSEQERAERQKIEESFQAFKNRTETRDETLNNTLSIISLGVNSLQENSKFTRDDIGEIKERLTHLERNTFERRN